MNMRKVTELIGIPVLLSLAVLFLLAVVTAGWLMHIPIAAFTVDVNAGAKVHPLVGVVSNIGIMLWTAAAAVALFTARVLDERGSREAAFFFSGGALTLVLSVDDFLQFHDRLAEMYLFIPEEGILAVYALAALSFIAVFFRRLNGPGRLLIGAAFAGFAVSILADKGFDSQDDLPILLEDGSKFLGIVCWFAYFVRAAYREITSEGVTAVKTPAARPDSPVHG